MGRILDALHALQEIETELGRLRRGENDRTRLVRAAERQIRRTNEKLSQFESERAATQLEVDRYDTQVKSRDETICKHREALLTARTFSICAQVMTSKSSCPSTVLYTAYTWVGSTSRSPYKGV